MFEKYEKKRQGYENVFFGVFSAFFLPILINKKKTYLKQAVLFAFFDYINENPPS